MRISSVQNYNIVSNQTFGAKVPNFVSKGYDKFTDKIAQGLGKIMDSKSVQKYADKFKDVNVAKHVFPATGILLSSFLMLSIANNDKIEEKRKKPLIVNTGISCALSTLGGDTIDSMLDKPIDAFKDKFVKLNANDPKLHKYIGGIKIAKSALVFGLLYRFVVPVVSMFLAEKVVEKPENKLNKKA